MKNKTSTTTNKELKASFLFKNKHFNTLYRFLFAEIPFHYERERLTLSDGDFIDLDKNLVNSNKLIIAVHGLEGSSHSSYILSLVKMANQQNIDVIAMNLRGCSGEPNLKLETYHSGKTSDLDEVVSYIEEKYSYKEIYIVGYSLGGNITLKYMGEYTNRLSSQIKGAVGISVPCDLKGSVESIQMAYQFGFLRTLKKKVKEKLQQFPDADIDVSKVLDVKKLIDYDNYFTAPVNGFVDANDYYTKASCKQFIPSINKPTLLISALDDPFLNLSCYPFQEEKDNSNFYMLTPKYGGHVGFYSSFKQSKNYWLEEQILAFIKKSIV